MSPAALILIEIDGESLERQRALVDGDRLALSVAERIRRVVRTGDHLEFLSDNKLALVLPEIGGSARCAATARRILNAMRAPIDIHAIPVRVTLSLGIAISPGDGLWWTALGEAAESALHRAKQEGQNRFAFFNKGLNQASRFETTIAEDLQSAIGTDALSVVYQPLMMSCGTRMRGLEALVRWTHPRLGPIAPDEFIPLAESHGLIVPLGEWVMRQACLDAKRWPQLRIAINVSPVQFRRRDFVETVRGILASTGVDPARVDLEITEGVLVQDEDQAEAIIMELRGLGVRIGLDDFGSGYASLIYLRRFAFDKIKIDREFLGSLEPHGEGAIILEHIVSLGHALGLTVTAEGVEQAEQLAFLRTLGCDELQGFLFSPPLLAAEVDERVTFATWMSTEARVAEDATPVAAGAQPERSAA